MIVLASSLGWRGAFLATAMIGFIVALALMAFGAPLAGREAARAKAATGGTAPKAGDWRVLMTWPVMLNLLFFVLISGVSVGVQNYSIVALQALWGTPISFGTTALTAYLLCSAFAVLLGGWITTRTHRHDLVATTGLALSGLALLPVAFIDLGAALLLFFMGLSGFFNGALQPSRDMIVRRGDSTRCFRAGVRLCHHRLQYRWCDRAAGLRLHDGYGFPTGDFHWFCSAFARRHPHRVGDGCRSPAHGGISHGRDLDFQ